jgi:RNA polymerase sigma-70 factor (ECF subfamily)
MQPEAIAAAFEAGRGAWPGLDVSLDRFAERLREQGVTDETLASRGADLLLAYACANGDRRALACFEEHFVSQVDLYVARLGLPPHVVDEVRQRLRVKLLTGDPPGMAQYRGRGPLGAWVRVTAVRFALELARASRPDDGASAADLLDFCFDLDEGPELAAVRTLYRDRLRAALEESLRALTPRDKTLLRLHVVDGLNIEAIGVMYRVHRATVARWLTAVRARVFDSVRERLALRRQPSSSEMRSLVALLEPDIQLSARRILGSDER